jgi:hypothetical protein
MYQQVFPPSAMGPDGPSIFNIDGLKRNDRSGPQVGQSRDGSYNLASTVLKGNGRGIVIPGQQSSYLEAIDMIHQMREDIVHVYATLMPSMVSLHEWEAIVFNAVDNNVLGFGGLGPNPTGLQMNVSSLENALSLSLAIGSVQGSWHVDFGDDPLRHTLFILFFQLPPGLYAIQLDDSTQADALH